ncbi:MAG: trimethylamine methyltransferase family protein [Pseudomonadota bacterium]
MPRRGRAEKHSQVAAPSVRRVDYSRLINTLPRARSFSDDQIEAIHQASLRVLEELGLRVLHPKGREILRAAGCDIRDEMMVHFPRALVEERLAMAPSAFTWIGGHGFEMEVSQETLFFGPGAGCPNVTDLDRGRRPGDLAAFTDFLKLQEYFDAIGKLGPSAEPQDVPLPVRHYATTKAQVELSRKIPWIYSRGTGQVEDSFEIIRIARGISEEAFRSAPYTSTVINTNSPRQLDVPMTQGIIDFARWGQVAVITPFCLSGAMAPITIAGSLTLSHAEAMAGITLSQIVQPGCPVVYGAFSSNVDMKSGAPVFGTPEHIQTNFGAGQLARKLGIPWRSAAGTAANSPDVQADLETQLALWGAVLAGANMIFHAAGWLEGGLTCSYEKFVTDIEACQTIAEAMRPVDASDEAIGFDAIAEVEPGGHFFAASQTMDRYATQFYEPMIRDWSNFGQWSEAGAVDATRRANAKWKEVLAGFTPPGLDPGARDEIDAFIARRTEEGGAHPLD